jgi:AAA family ATP:ADP antiporter
MSTPPSHDDPPDLSPKPGGATLRALNIRRGELPLVLGSVAYVFFLFSAYAVIKPMRDAMGLAGGVRQLPYLFLFTFGVMLIANPIYSALVARVPRRRFIPITYLFFALNLLVFYVVMLALSGTGRSVFGPAHGGMIAIFGLTTALGRVFYVWASIFNLFVLTVFWGMMADIYSSEQSKRLFPRIAVGATLGSILGASMTKLLIKLEIAEMHLLLVSIGFLCLATTSSMLVMRQRRFRERSTVTPELTAPTRPPRPDTPHAERIFDDRLGHDDDPTGGGVFRGITMMARSPYLLGICLFLLIYTFTGTMMYFQQAQIVDAAELTTRARTGVFADIDLITNLLTLVAQCYLAGLIVPRLGVGRTLALLPLVVAAGFTALAVHPVLGVLIAVQVARRSINYALAKPAREMLFTVVSREEKYKSKHFIDTFIYRGGDALGAAVFAVLVSRELGNNVIACIGAVVAAAWLVLALWLGTRQRRLADRADAGHGRSHAAELAGDAAPATARSAAAAR